MNGVLKFQIKENAVFTATPFLTLWFFSIFISKTLDTLRARGSITTTTARKTATMISSIVPLFCLLALCFVGCRKMLAVLLAVRFHFNIHFEWKIIKHDFLFRALV